MLSFLLWIETNSSERGGWFRCETRRDLRLCSKIGFHICVELIRLTYDPNVLIRFQALYTNLNLCRLIHPAHPHNPKLSSLVTPLDFDCSSRIESTTEPAQPCSARTRIKRIRHMIGGLSRLIHYPHTDWDHCLHALVAALSCPQA
jgi:hypothetical protein